MYELMIEVECCDRWQAYHRLKDLGIDCECRAYQPLKVRGDTPSQILQTWSVLRMVSSDRNHLVSHLERCWQMSHKRHRYFSQGL